MSFKISLDGMGGDNAPDSVIQGAAIAKSRMMGDAHFVIYGDEGKLRPLLEKEKNLADCTTIHHCDLVIAGDEKPSNALRTGKNSSMGMAIQAVADGDCQAVVSSGNTGAVMALSMFGLKRLSGVNRPAIAAFFPTLRGESCVLDLGANITADAHNLIEFAVMGQAFASAALGIERPSVGILNVGVEETKGHEELKVAAQFLKETNLPMDFKGFIEGDGISRGDVDVVITDGFTGNVFLKASEGMAKMAKEYLISSFKSSLFAKIGYPFYMGALKNLKFRLDPRRYNGAVFLGLNGIAIKSHGGSDKYAFASAVQLVGDLIVRDELGHMQKNLTYLEQLKQEYSEKMTTAS